jgi:hypothetical protein
MAMRGLRVHFTDYLLISTILFGILLSVANLIIAVVNGRFSQMAEIKASANVRELYERSYKRTRRLVSMPWIGKPERRTPPPDGPRKG